MWTILINVAYTALKSFVQWKQGTKLSDSEFLAFIEAHQASSSSLGEMADEVAESWDQIELPLQEGFYPVSSPEINLVIDHCERPAGYYAKLYSTMQVLDTHKSTLQWYKQVALKHKDLYTRSSKYVENSIKLSVPWQVIACLHAMEASFDPRKQILNGQSFLQKTTIVPKGKGPWPSFEASCVDAFREKHWQGVDFNNIESLLNAVERYNGVGYQKRCKASPYLWSFSNHGIGTGKFVEDGKYSSIAVSKQAGFACILKVLGYA